MKQGAKYRHRPFFTVKSANEARNADIFYSISNDPEVNVKTCERCGDQFACNPGSDQVCWCLTAGPLKTLPKKYKDCLCPACLKIFAKDSSTQVIGELVEDEDI